MILITGASQGIGYACAQMILARTSEEVTITGRSLERLEIARASVAAPVRDRLHVRVCNQSLSDDVNSLRSWIVNTAPGLRGAVLNVGVNPAWTTGHRRAHKLSDSCIDETISTNCTHAMLLTATLLDTFVKARSGVLIWIGSQAQHIGMPGASLYCATKSFLSGLALSVAHEYGGRGVQTCLVNPGAVRTTRTAHVVDLFARNKGLRVQEPDEIADYVTDLFAGSRTFHATVNL